VTISLENDYGSVIFTLQEVENVPQSVKVQLCWLGNRTSVARIFLFFLREFS